MRYFGLLDYTFMGIYVLVLVGMGLLSSCGMVPSEGPSPEGLTQKGAAQ